MRTAWELLRTKVLMGTQVVKFAPRQIAAEALTAMSVVERVQRIHDGKQQRIPQTLDEQTLWFPGI